MLRQHFVETIVQRVADRRGTPIDLEQRSAMAYFLNEAFRTMPLAEFVQAVRIYHT